MPLSTTLHRHHLSRIRPVVWIEARPHRTHHGQRIVVEHLRHVIQLVQSDPMFAGDRATGLDTRLHDLRHRGVHPLRRAWFVGIVRNIGMEIAVARMKHIAHLDTVSCADAGDDVEYFGKSGARYNGVLHDERGRDATHGPERFLASLPQSHALLVGCGNAHLACCMLVATTADGFHIVFESGFQPVNFAQQNRCGVNRIACRVDGCFDGADGGVIHHLERGRNDAGCDDAGDRTRRVVQTVEVGKECSHRLRQRHEPHPHIGRDTEATFRADKKSQQVVSLSVTIRIAETPNVPVGQYDVECNDMIECDAVLEAVRPTGVLRDIAADGTHRLTGRIGRVVQSQRGDGAREPCVHDTGLNMRDAIGPVDFHDACEAIEAEQYHTVGECAAR